MLIVWFLSIKSLPNLLFGMLCLPGDQSHPVCATDNKPSCVLHLLGWFIGSRGFSSLERRSEFGVLHCMVFQKKKKNYRFYFRAMVTNREPCASRDIGFCLQTFLVVKAEGHCWLSVERSSGSC